MTVGLYDGVLYDDVIGEDRAVALLRAAARRPVHAYLLVGPAGTGKRAAATSFAASLLCPTRGVHTGDDMQPCETCRRVRAGLHPDVVQVEREGASISIGAAREVIRGAYLSPVEGSRKVVVLHDFHLVRDTGPALLKTIEEPPPTTVFVILAEFLPPDLVTIASRCVKVEFEPLTAGQVVDALVAGGTEPARAQALAAAAGGRLDRARLLATDAQFEVRRRAWYEIPGRLDGRGASAASVADELIGYLDSSVEPLEARQATERQQLIERNEKNAEVVGSGRAAKGRARATKAALNAGVSELEERHKREVRRQRTDELRAGLGTLAQAYRDRLAGAVQEAPGGKAEAIEAVRLIDKLVADLRFNPGELLALQALLARLGRLGLTP